MQVWLRLLLIATIIFSASAFVWFLLGSTAYFQRGMDIIGTTYLWGIGIPVLLFVGLFTVLLIKGWTPTSKGGYVGICVVLVLSTLLSIALLQSVSTNGWANEKIRSDSLKITADEKYEYRIELINLFQRNSHARLYLKNVDSGVETYIPIEIQTRKIVGLRVSEVNHWVKLEAMDNVSQYILYTTKDLGIPEENFKIDITAGTASRVN
ncbi:hypothetical protein GCM10010912_69590 [Paenibacillus albidus]|uniref:Uncharacterized protein n=1 Tax=Paenibacillus albidus TaxID=2041023 RepID=A0A917LDV0_9BACL|nr:copper transporter family protein [Paenibacillus albidus]GGG15245.1 hypothetical protein GCM10010912_69590 [Paenibacillus albidus]